MRAFLLDTSALLTLRDDEPGADNVAHILETAAREPGKALGCFMTLMEVYYRVWKDEGEQEGRLAYEQCFSLPIVWIHETPELLQRAAAIKATRTVSLADAWIAASADLNGAILVHKDPEFESVPVEQRLLPYKS
jgi:predicted nucleic acid-binding protein